VRVVDHHDAIVFFSEAAKFAAAQLSPSLKNAVGDDQLLSRKAGVLLQDALAVFHIFMLEDFDCRSRKAELRR